MEMLISTAILVLDIYTWMILACVIISWIPELQRNKIAEILSRIVDPFLAIFRRFIPPIGMLDITPLVAMMLLQLSATGLSRW